MTTKPQPITPLCAILGKDAPPSLRKLKPSQRNFFATMVNLAKLELERRYREAAYEEGNVSNKHAINQRREWAQDSRRIAVRERSTAKRTKPISPAGFAKWVKTANKYLSREKLIPVGYSGALSYSAKLDELKQGTQPERIMVKVKSRWSLLKMLRRKTKGTNFRALDADIKSMLEPIGNHPPLLASYEVLKNGRLRLEVNSYWLPSGNFMMVPLPLPKDDVAQMLYLFLHTIDLNSRHGKPLGELCAWLGISMRWPTDGERALKRAVAAINRYLKTLDWEALANIKKLKTPKAINMRISHGKVYFSALDRVESREEPRPMKQEQSTPAPKVATRVFRDDEVIEVDFDKPGFIADAKWYAEKRKQRADKQERDRQIMASAEAMRQELEADLQRSMFSPMNPYGSADE